MISETLLFYAFAAIAIGTAIWVVTMKNLARALFLLFATLFAMAGLYIFALADFVAVTQVIVYVGGVLVLMLFAFMLSNKELLDNLQSHRWGFLELPRWQALLVAACFGGILIYTAIVLPHDLPAWMLAAQQDGTVFSPEDHTIHHIGIQLMTRYLLPFEVISVLLLMVLIGAAHIARKERQP